MNTLRIGKCRISALVVLALLAGSVSFIYPYGRDQATYALVGKMILEGKIPYRDAWDVKPPGIFYIYAAAQKLLGQSSRSIRTVDLVWQTVTTVAVGLIGSIVLKSGTMGLFSGLTYVFAYFSNDYWNTCQPEGFATLPICIAVYFSLNGRRPQRSLFIAGFLIACSSLLKYPLALLLLLPAVSLLSNRGKARDMSILLSGFLIPFAMTSLFFVLNSAWGDLFYSQFVYAYSHTTSGLENQPFLAYLARTGLYMSRSLLSFRYAFLTLLSVPAVILVFKTKVKAELLLVVWLSVGLVHVLAHGKLFSYHFLPLLAPMSVLAMISVREMTLHWWSRARAAVVSSAAIVYLCILFQPLCTYGQGYSRLFRMATGRMSRMEYFEELCPRGRKTNFCLPYDIEAAEHIKANTDPGDRIFVWGFEPLIYLESARAPASRFIYNVPLYCRWADKDLQREVMSILSSVGARYIVVAHNDSLPAISGLHIDSQEALERLPGLARYIEDMYDREKDIGHFTLFSPTTR